MMLQRPFSQACENNKQSILDVLATVFTESGTILEIGSGSGQHAVHFAGHLPHLTWQPSDQSQYLPGCRMWIADAALKNVAAPLELDVMRQPWPVTAAAGVFSANTAHIMHWPMVQAMFAGVSAVLTSGHYFCLYGPFKYHGSHTSASNARFDQQLRAEDPGMGVRDIDDLELLTTQNGFDLVNDHALPANNRLLVWRKQ